jgi:hypothetical protein
MKQHLLMYLKEKLTSNLWLDPQVSFHFVSSADVIGLQQQLQHSSLGNMLMYHVDKVNY